MDQAITAVQQQDEDADSAEADNSTKTKEGVLAAKAISSGSSITETTSTSIIPEKEMNGDNGCNTETLAKKKMSTSKKQGALSESTASKPKKNSKKSLVAAKQWDTEIRAIRDIVITRKADADDGPIVKASSNNVETADTRVIQDIVITCKVDADGGPIVKASSNNVETVDTSIEQEISLVMANSLGQPVSPYSDKEADQSGEKVLLIDESDVSHSDSAADVSHTSTKVLDLGNVDELTAKVQEITEKPDIEPAITVEKNIPEVAITPVAEVAITPVVRVLSKIEASIERCIANYTCDSSEGELTSPVATPVRKRSAAASKSTIAEKFPRNYGFKIITNKIDFPATPRGPFNVVSAVRDDSPILSNNLQLKRIRIQGKPLRDATSDAWSHDETEQDSTLKDTSKTSSNITVSVWQSSDDTGEKITPTDRPAMGLKVRDVDSINAAIRTVKAPVCLVPSDASNNIADSYASEKRFHDNEMFNHAGEQGAESGAETPAIACKPNLRPIAPKCKPIASNDNQAVKMIRDLIQLPSVPVYVPDVTESKHFNGRLHLCHGCGDRFVLLKSLLEHQNRRSCVIKFQCLKCDSMVLCFFNRCEFIRHLYNHNQTLTTVMLQYHIVVERLPASHSGIFDVKICQECKVFLKVNLSDHMQGNDVDKKPPDLSLKCQWCSLLLPTKCAYQAHRRMHFLQPPHVCPECGETSPDLPTFNVHINSVCFHTSKRSMFRCSHCRVEVYDGRKLERHIRTKHIRDVFKCNFCFVACFNIKDLERHRRVNHEEKVAEEPLDEDDSGLKYAFHLCDMCPNRLIRRVRLGQHVWDHTYSNGKVSSMYECRKCKSYFSSKKILLAHSSRCSAGSTNASTQSFATVVTNEQLLQAQSDSLLITPVSRSPVADEEEVPGPDANFEVLNDISDGVPLQADSPEVDDMMMVDAKDLPPPLLKAPVIIQPVTQPVIIPVTHPATLPVIPPSVVPPATKPSNSDVTVPPKKKKKKKAAKKPPVQTETVSCGSPKDDNSFNSFEREIFMEGESLDAEGEGKEIVLNCLDCGTDLTCELGNYCMMCEQKREAGDSLKMAAPNPLLNVAKKKPPKKSSSGNFSCRICNALISVTCDKAAIKRHFISKHKQIFIAALQSGLNARKNGLLSASSILTQKRKDGSKDQSRTKKSPGTSLSKISPKKKKKKTRKPIGGRLSQSDTEDDEDSSYAVSLSKEGKKTKEKRKRTYSPAFPALEQGMVASDSKVSESSENTRSCYKCPFKSSDKDEFMAHVITHKSNPKDLQCPACGVCFVVRPSLEKHLLILHGVENFDQYLEEHGIPPVENVSELDVDMLDVNQCKVCHLKFDTEALLEKHFRTHGSAFLLSKQFRRS